MPVIQLKSRIQKVASKNFDIKKKISILKKKITIYYAVKFDFTDSFEGVKCDFMYLELHFYVRKLVRNNEFFPKYMKK